MYLQYQLHHLCVNQTVNRLSINLGDQVPLPQTCILGRTAILHMLRANRYRWSDGRWGGKKGQEPKDGEKQKDGRNGNVFWAYGPVLQVFTAIFCQQQESQHTPPSFCIFYTG